MEISIINTVTWLGIILAILFGICGYKYRMGIREGVLRMGQKKVHLYLTPLYVVMVLMSATLLVDTSLELPTGTIAVTAMLAGLNAFFLIEARSAIASKTEK